jgi:putative transposase
LQTAYVNFWGKRAKYPTFKKKGKSTDSATYFRNCFTYRDGRITLAKQDRPLDIRWSRSLPEGADPSQVTISGNSRGRYHISILVETTVAELPRETSTVGIDAGITTLVMSTRIIRENQTVVIEDLAIRNMVRNHSLARAISDASWSEFRRQWEYKADWYGRTVIVIDRWYPSGKTCSVCGAIVEKLPLDVREWVCRCGARHDRDVNAAKVIHAAGLAVSASGG